MRRFFRKIAFYLFQLLFVAPILLWIIGPRYRRRGKLPEGPCVIVANHNSHLDASVLMWIFPPSRIFRIHPAAAADYFSTNWIRRLFAMFFMNAVGIERRPAAGQDPLAPLAEMLRNGESLIFFPEGSRGEAGVVAKFRPGIGRLLRTVPGTLVVPVFMSGAERIWPRGQVLPVPGSIDVNVGRARSYSSELNARDIAEQIREDVLALAPPPPPVPGPRPAPPVRVSVCCIDPQIKESFERRLTERFGAMEKAMAIGEPTLEADADGVREIPQPIPLTRSRAMLGFLSWFFRTSDRYRGPRFAELVEKAALDEAFDHGALARTVIGGGTPLVELLAWAHADASEELLDVVALPELVSYLLGQRKVQLRRWWRFIRRAPEVWLINTFDLAHLRAPDVIVQIDTSSASAMRRIRSRGMPLQPYENELFLGRLQGGFHQAIRTLRQRKSIDVLELDPARMSEERIEQLLDELCERHRPAEPGKAAGE